MLEASSTDFGASRQYIKACPIRGLTGSSPCLFMLSIFLIHIAFLMSLPALSDSRSVTLAFAQSITWFSLQTWSVIADLLDADWGVLDGVHIGSTWRIWLTVHVRRRCGLMSDSLTTCCIVYWSVGSVVWTLMVACTTLITTRGQRLGRDRTSTWWTTWNSSTRWDRTGRWTSWPTGSSTHSSRL